MNDNQYVRRPLTVDELDPESRAFYERALWKRCLSFFFIALGMLLLGFCTEAGTLAHVNQTYYNSDAASEERYMAYRRGSGYGFACFCNLLGFFLSIGMAIYISPDVSSTKEKAILLSPQNLDVLSSPEYLDRALKRASNNPHPFNTNKKDDDANQALNPGPSSSDQGAVVNPDGTGNI